MTAEPARHTQRASEKSRITTVSARASRGASTTGCDAIEAELLGACLTAVAGVRAVQPAARQTLHALLKLHGLDRCIEVLREHIA